MHSSRGRHTKRSLFSQSHSPYSNYQNQHTSNTPSIFLSKFEFSPLKGLLTNRPSVLKKMILQQLDRKNLSLELTEDIFVEYMKKYTNQTCDRFSARDAFVNMIDDWTHLKLCEFIHKEKIYYPISRMHQSQNQISKMIQLSNHQLSTSLFNAKNLEKYKNIKQLKKEFKLKFDDDRYEKDVNMKRDKHSMKDNSCVEETQTSCDSTGLPLVVDENQTCNETSTDAPLRITIEHIQVSDKSVKRTDELVQVSDKLVMNVMDIEKSTDKPEQDPSEVHSVFILPEKSTAEVVMTSEAIPEPIVLYTDKPTEKAVESFEYTKQVVDNEVWASISSEEETFADPVHQHMETNSTTVQNSNTCQIM